MTVTPPRVPRPDGREDSGQQEAPRVPAGAAGAVGAASAVGAAGAPVTASAPIAAGTPVAPVAPETAETPEDPENPENPESAESAESAENPESAESAESAEVSNSPGSPDARSSVVVPDAPETAGPAGTPDAPETTGPAGTPETTGPAGTPETTGPAGTPDAPDSPAAPSAPAAAEARETPESPDVEAQATSTAPEAPEAPATPATSSAPEAPETPQAPATPVTPTAPEAPKTPETPAASVTPTAPDAPETPHAPATPATPTAPDAPGIPETPAAPAPLAVPPARTAAPDPALPTALHPTPARTAEPEAPQASGSPQNVKQDVQESRGFLARAALLTAVLSIAGSVLGLARDQALARLFGAGSDTDAFLVAWTVPEFAATLLIEDGLAFVLVPAFSLALARRARGAGGDPVRALVAATAPRLLLALAAVAALVVAAAPHLVAALAPGLPDPALAVDCTRLTATCVLSFGLAGYCSAALRAHRRFLAPASIYVAYNTAIITGMFVLGGRWGVRSAAVGVAAGGCLMVAVQVPSLLRQLGRRSASAPGGEAGDGARPVALALVATVLLFALCRQSQVLIERYLASHLSAGAISHLNYAQKVAQIPMTMSLMLCTVTFPVVARALADGDSERARARVERDLALAASVVLLGTAAVVACAPQIVEVLFQRGAFTAGDTAATARVMRVYALGLLGQTLVGALIRSYFGAGRPTWYPVVAMALGIVATSWIGAWAVGPWGTCGIAAANAAGISLTAALLLAGTRRRGVVPIRVRPVLGELSRPLRAALVATLAGAFAASRPAAPGLSLAAGLLTVTVVFALLGRALGAQGVAPAFRFVRSVTRRLAHGRIR